VYKIVLKCIIMLLCGMAGLLFLLPLQSLPAYANGGAQVSISMPNNAPLVGHVGTRVEINGSNFPANATVNLFTTPAYSTSKCRAPALKNLSNYGLAPFDSAPTTNTDGQGSFQLSTTWPNSANQATTNYYVCAIASSSSGNSNNNGSGNSQQGAALSAKNNSFTVAQPVQIKVSAQSAQAGGTVTINAGDTVTVNGTGWLPPQQLAIDIESNNGMLTSTTVQSGSIDSMTGNFSVNLTIPATTNPRDYDVKVYAPNEPTMTQTASAAITVNSSANATSQTTPTVQTTVQAASTPVATSNSASRNSVGGGSNLLAFALAGLGAILVVVGITVFVIYSRGRPV
jgi:hypothetical protein